MGCIPPYEFGERDWGALFGRGGFDDFSDVDEVYLSAEGLVGGVYDYGFAVSCGSGVGVYAPFALVFWWEVEAAEVYFFGGFYVEEVWGD